MAPQEVPTPSAGHGQRMPTAPCIDGIVPTPCVQTRRDCAQWTLACSSVLYLAWLRLRPSSGTGALAFSLNPVRRKDK